MFSFAQARLSPDGLFGLYFTIGSVILVGAVWIFGGISEDLITRDPLIIVDKILSEVFHYLANPGVGAVMHFVSMLASVEAIGILCVVTAAIFVYQHRWYWLLALVLVVAGGISVNLLLKELFHRPRPGWADPLMALSYPGFPSGHTMMATLMYGFIATYLVLAIASWQWRIVIAVCTVVLVIAVAFSRMYLGAHYLSDVLGAMAAGTAWLALCLIAVETLRRRRLLNSSARAARD